MNDPTLILGVDPGLSGALAFLDISNGDLEIHDMPTHGVTVNRKAKRRLDLYALGMLLDAKRNSIRHAIVEDPNAMPGQGSVSTWAFGYAVGAVQAAVAANIIPMTLVKPAVWKRAMGLTQDKDASRRLASSLLPRHAALWSRVKDDGRAEAALLAVYFATRK